jgi:outer membrane immunogenic protein
MTKIALALAASTAVFFGAVAVAADLPAKAPMYAPAPVAMFTWTGFYIGGNVGYHWGEDRTTTAANPIGWTLAGAGAIDATTPGTSKLSGITAGGQVGFNYQIGNFVWGIEGDVNWLGGNTPTRVVTPFTVINPADVFTTSVEPRFMATVRPRLGVAMDRVLFYVTGGLAISNARFTDSFGSFGNTDIASVTTSATTLGWTGGGGLEYAFANNWSAKFEYLYADFGTINTSIPSCVTCAPGSNITVRHRYIENLARVGLNFRF